MTTAVTARLGLSVLYTLTDSDVKAIIQRRRDAGSASRSGNEPREGDTYPALIVRDNGMDPKEHARIRELIASGKYAADTIEKVSVLVEDEYRTDEGRQKLIEQQLAGHDASPQAASVNLQVFLDGNDCYWATSRSEFDPEKHGQRAQFERGGQTYDGELIPDSKGHWFASAAR